MAAPRFENNLVQVRRPAGGRETLPWRVRFENLDLVEHAGPHQARVHRHVGYEVLVARQGPYRCHINDCAVSVPTGGVDIGVHALDLGMWLMGFPEPVRVSGTTMVNFAHGHEMPPGWSDWDRSRFNVEDFASGFVHFANGATMVIEASWLQHQLEKEDFSAQLFGRKAMVKWPSGDLATVLGGTLVDAKVQEVAGLKPSHSEEILAFTDAIRHGRPSPVPVDQTLKVITILEAIVESGRQGREITLSPAASR